MSKWIPCNENTEEQYREVLCCNKYGEELIGYLLHQEDGWVCTTENVDLLFVTAYMELPEPYKGETE